MPAITPEFMWDLESRMRLITAREYERLTKNLWWNKIMREAPSGAKKERVSWLLDTAKIEYTGKGGNVEFDDVVALTHETENLNASNGLSVHRNNFEDLDGNGIQVAAHRSREWGNYAAYWPQKVLAKAIRDNNKTYDGKRFFATDHPVNPFLKSAGTYSNLLSGYPIDASVTVDEAVNNIVAVIAAIAQIKMPNGEDPRFLRPAFLMHPPALAGRAQQITNARLIAQAAGSTGGGGADVEALIRNFGFAQPVRCDELASGFPGGSDTAYYLAVEDVLTNELGAYLYYNRQPFQVLFYGPQNSAQLARIQKFEWTTHGRNVVQEGHPYLLFKITP